MIVVTLYGGLGNQMFQYAVAKSLALKCNQSLAIDISRFEDYKLHNYSLYHFNIKAKIYKEPNWYFKKFQSLFFKKISYIEKDFGFDEKVLNLKADYIYLDGYFQTENYFIDYENEIRDDFRLISNIKNETKEILNSIKSINSVTIHIRRGDYLNNPKHYIETEEYYKNAIELIEKKVENPVFVIFSDDMDWVKNNFHLKYKTIYVDFNNAFSNFEDLHLMSNCKHNIITNSSFSWWGAWLNENNNKIVIAPKKWYNDNSNSKDVVPSTWIKI